MVFWYSQATIMLVCKRAFTLIELLVVISIITLLISMLLPGIKQTRTLARTIQCQSSLHQLLAATRAFSEENDDRLPHVDVSRGGHFPAGYQPDPSMSWLSGVVTEIMGIRMNVPSDFWCPEASSEQPFTPSWPGYFWSMASTRSYGINDWGGASTLRAAWVVQLADTDTSKRYICTPTPTGPIRTTATQPHLGTIQVFSAPGLMSRPTMWTTAIPNKSIWLTWTDT